LSKVTEKTLNAGISMPSSFFRDYGLHHLARGGAGACWVYCSTGLAKFIPCKFIPVFKAKAVVLNDMFCGGKLIVNSVPMYKKYKIPCYI
jgi:hypothetical protein